MNALAHFSFWLSLMLQSLAITCTVSQSYRFLTHSFSRNHRLLPVPVDWTASSASEFSLHFFSSCSFLLLLFAFHFLDIIWACFFFLTVDVILIFVLLVNKFFFSSAALSQSHSSILYFTVLDNLLHSLSSTFSSSHSSSVFPIVTVNIACLEPRIFVFRFLSHIFARLFYHVFISALSCLLDTVPQAGDHSLDLRCRKFVFCS